MSLPFTQYPAAVQKIYRGNEKCPRTVVIQILVQPVLNANLFISSDKAELDMAVPSVNNCLTSGIGVINFGGTVDRLILEDVTTDIFARANQYGDVGALIIGVESF